MDRRGPASRRGWLQSVQDDYCTLWCEDGALLHLPLHHIRSVTPLAPPVGEIDLPSGSQPPATFAEFLSAHLGKRVRLYHVGPETSVGTLRECDTDHVLLEMQSGQIICFTVFHIRSVWVLPEQDAVDSAAAAEPVGGR